MILLPLFAFAALENTHALIWSSETSVAAAEQKRAEAEKALIAAGLVFGKGFPRVVRSDDVSGLKPGYEVVLLGYCEKVEPVLSLAKSAGKQTYARDVTLHDAQLADASCPTPKPLPLMLIYRTGKNRVALEQTGKRVIALKEVPTRGKRHFPEGDTHAAVLGVCPPERATITIDAISLSAILQPVTDQTPIDCPKLTGRDAQSALGPILRAGHDGWARELLAAEPALLDRMTLYAAEHGRAELLAELLKKKPKLSADVMQRALESDNADVVRLVGRAGVAVNENSCATFARGSSERAKAMVDVGFKPAPCGRYLYVLLQDDERFVLAKKNGLALDASAISTAMVEAVRSGNEPSIAKLRALGFDEAQPSAAAILEDQGAKLVLSEMPGLLAAYDNHKAEVPKLEAKEIERSLGGVTPLLLALRRGHAEVALALLLRGAKVVPGAVNAGAALGSGELMRKLLARSPNVAEALKETFAVLGVTERAITRVHAEGSATVVLLPLHRAALNGDVITVRALLDAGAVVDARDESKLGLTALMLAAQTGKREAALVLESKRADLAAVDALGHTAFDHALVHVDSKPLIERWVKSRRELAARPGTLGIAGLFADEDTLHMLIGRGAGRNGEGRKAANLVCSEGQLDRHFAFELLKEKYGAEKKGWEGDSSEYCRTQGC